MTWRTEARRPFLFLFYVAIDPFIIIADFSTNSGSIASELNDIRNTTLGFAVSAAWFLLLRFVYRKLNLEKNSPWIAVIFMGVSVAWTATVADNAFGVLFNGGNWQGIFDVGPISYGLGIALAVSVAKLAEAREKYNDMRLSIISANVAEATKTEKSATIPAIKEFILHARERLLRQESSREEVAGDIRELVDKKLRPISHKIWRQEDAKFTRLSSGRLFALALTTTPRAPIGAALFAAGASIPSTLNFFGNQLGVARLLLLFLSIWAGLVITSRLVSLLGGKKFFGPVSFFGPTLMAAFFALMIPGTIIGNLSNQDDFRYLLVAWSVISLASLVGNIISISSRLLRDQDQLFNERVMSQISGDSSGVFEFIRARDIANYLHGSTQNQLLALAGRIERESDTSLELLIQEVMKVLEDAGGVIEEQPESFVGKLERMRQSWSGLIQINIHHPEVVGENQSELVLIICREAISNAFRHGKASHMDISFSTSNSTLSIRCEDDGLGPTKGKAGLGSELFELASHWSLTAKENGGAVLEININD